MEKEETITQILLVEHGKLREMLARFIREAERDRGAGKMALDLFIKKERAHVSIEEKVLFKIRVSKEIKIVKILVKQHKTMTKIIQNLKKLFKDKKDIFEEAGKLQVFLRVHTNLEEEKFYKVLDREMNSENKIKLIEKIKILFDS